MLLPAIQYGNFRTVNSRMRTVSTQLQQGADLVDVMTADGMLDTATTPGMLVMRGIKQGFRCFEPWSHVWDPLFEMRADPAMPTKIEDAIFAASLGTSWGVLGLLAHDRQSWAFPAWRYRPLLHAAVERWPELDAVGARYQWDWDVKGQRLWSVPNNLHFVLAKLGVSAEHLRAPLPPEGPRALLRFVRSVN